MLTSCMQISISNGTPQLLTLSLTADDKVVVAASDFGMSMEWVDFERAFWHMAHLHRDRLREKIGDARRKTDGRPKETEDDA